MSRSVDTVLSIYQGGPPSTVKTLTGKTPQEVRDILEQLTKNLEVQINSNLSTAPVVQEEQRKEINEPNDIQTSNRNVNEYPLHFDTRNQNIPLEQILQDSPFFPIDLNNQQIQENNRDRSPDPNQYLQSFTVVNSSNTLLFLSHNFNTFFFI